jgi:hypothetical protein
MGSGIVLAGRQVQVPGIDVVNYVDDVRLRLAPGDVRRRRPDERSWVHAVVLHTTAGIPGGKDLRPQLVRPGTGSSTGGGQRVVASWTHDKDRPGGAHLVVDQDGTSYCCADLVLEAAYHARLANGASVGIEVVQGRDDADLYAGQLTAAAKLALWVCLLLPTPVQWQIPRGYSGPLKRFSARPCLDDYVGLVGHRDLTGSRGRGDPGDAVMDELVRQGCEAFDVDGDEDLKVWRDRQSQLGVEPDGVPGPDTVQAIVDSGTPEGVWRRRVG